MSLGLAHLICLLGPLHFISPSTNDGEWCVGLREEIWDDLISSKRIFMHEEK